MKVIETSPLFWATGDALSPEDLNRAWLYAKDAIIDVREKRWARSAITFPFVEDVGTPYTQAMNAEELTYRFICPVTCIVERGFLHGNFTASADFAVRLLKSSDSSVPQGATNPYLEFDAAVTDAAVDTTEINVDKALLVAGTEYKIVVSGTTFSLNRADVTLHIACDRWTTAGSLALPNFDPTLFTDYTKLNGATAATNNTNLSTEAAKFANAKTAPHPLLFVKHGLLSGTDADLRTFNIPRFDPARAKARIKRLYLWAYTAGACTISAQLQDETGANVGSAVNAVVAATTGSADSGALSVSLEQAAGASADTTKDYRVVLANSSAVNNAIKVYALLWLARL